MSRKKKENLDEVQPQDVVVSRAEKVVAKSKADQAAKQERRLAQWARQFHLTVPQFLEFSKAVADGTV